MKYIGYLLQRIIIHADIQSNIYNLHIFKNATRFNSKTNKKAKVSKPKQQQKVKSKKTSHCYLERSREKIKKFCLFLRFVYLHIYFTFMSMFASNCVYCMYVWYPRMS